MALHYPLSRQEAGEKHDVAKGEFDSAPTWDLSTQDETFVHSHYYESEPGEVDVDADWAEILDDPAVLELAGTLIGFVAGDVKPAEASAAVAKRLMENRVREDAEPESE